MKKTMSVDQLRKIIREEILRGMPDFLVNEAAIKYVEEIRKHVHAYINRNAKNQDSARDVKCEAETVLKELEEELVELTKDKITKFTYAI